MKHKGGDFDGRQTVMSHSSTVIRAQKKNRWIPSYNEVHIEVSAQEEKVKHILLLKDERISFIDLVETVIASKDVSTRPFAVTILRLECVCEEQTNHI